MKKFKFVVTMEVSQNWIDDGFGSDMEAIKETIQSSLYSNLLQ